MRWKAGQSRPYSHEPTVRKAAELLTSFGLDVDVSPDEPGKPKPPTKPVDVGPYRTDSIEVAEKYAKSLQASWNAPYLEGTTRNIAMAADAHGLDYTLALAVAHQESLFKNTTGADAGGPYKHVEATKEIAQKLLAHVRAGGTSQGFGIFQLTWKGFLQEAESMGGLHIQINQCMVACKLLASHIETYGAVQGVERYNGYKNGAHPYADKVFALQRDWQRRLAK